MREKNEYAPLTLTSNSGNPKHDVQTQLRTLSSHQLSLIFEGIGMTNQTGRTAINYIYVRPSIPFTEAPIAVRKNQYFTVHWRRKLHQLILWHDRNFR